MKMSTGKTHTKVSKRYCPDSVSPSHLLVSRERRNREGEWISWDHHDNSLPIISGIWATQSPENFFPQTSSGHLFNLAVRLGAVEVCTEQDAINKDTPSEEERWAENNSFCAVVTFSKKAISSSTKLHLLTLSKNATPCEPIGGIFIQTITDTQRLILWNDLKIEGIVSILWVALVLGHSIWDFAPTVQN